MKRLIFTIIPLAAGLLVAAQTEEADSTVVTQTSSSTNEAKAENLKVIGNNRNIFYFNGQKATPSGHQATAVGAGYAALGDKSEKPFNEFISPGAHGTHGVPVIGNNRLILHWSNGQRATPTGHQAAAMGGGYAALGNYKNKFIARDEDDKENGFINDSNKDPRDIYKKNGQAATKTGHQATGIGSGYSFSKKDK